jgi:hypothetical protein
MVLSRLAPVRWLWCVFVLTSLGACSAPYHFRYQYALVAAEGSSSNIDNDRLRVFVVPTAEVGVLQLTVVNKGIESITIVWAQTRYVDPLGQTRPVVNADASGLFAPQGWPASGTRLVSGETFAATVRPGGVHTAHPLSLSPYAGQPDPRLPYDPEFRPSGRPTERVSLNPFTVSRSTGGEVTVSSALPPLVPTSGTTPTLGQAYRGREFRFILALHLDARLTSYTFTFRITDVEVQQSSG